MIKAKMIILLASLFLYCFNMHGADTQTMVRVKPNDYLNIYEKIKNIDSERITIKKKYGIPQILNKSKGRGCNPNPTLRITYFNNVIQRQIDMGNHNLTQYIITAHVNSHFDFVTHFFELRFLHKIIRKESKGSLEGPLEVTASKLIPTYLKALANFDENILDDDSKKENYNYCLSLLKTSLNNALQEMKVKLEKTKYNAICKILPEQQPQLLERLCRTFDMNDSLHNFKFEDIPIQEDIPIKPELLTRCEESYLMLLKTQSFSIDSNLCTHNLDGFKHFLRDAEDTGLSKLFNKFLISSKQPVQQLRQYLFDPHTLILIAQTENKFSGYKTLPHTRDNGEIIIYVDCQGESTSVTRFC